MALPLSHRYMDMCVNVIRIYTKPKRGEMPGEGTGNGVVAKGDLALLYSVQVSVLFLKF